MEMNCNMKVLCLLFATVVTVRGHGRLWEPPSRSSMFRRGYTTPPNYNDNQLNCGGFANQWSAPNRGKCGICGDPYNGDRLNEAGGKYATGLITRKYLEGQTIDIDVQVTANHLGWFEFRICPNNNVKKAATQKCLDQHVLQLADRSGTKYYISSDVGHYKMKYTLPTGLACTQCVLQWKWHVGNSWGTDPDGRSGIGFGPQEEFYGCSDVAIQGSDTVKPMTTSNVHKPTTTTDKITTTTPRPTTTTAKPTTTTTKPTTTTPKPTTTTPTPTTTTAKPTTTTAKPTTTTAKPTTTTAKPTTTTAKSTTTTHGPTTTPKPTTTNPMLTSKQETNKGDPAAAAQSSTCIVVVSPVYSQVPGMLKWCRMNCARGYCPRTHCRCV
ncbi:mucin-5AC-like [Pecten maximus]|uniref:mucin-5AC-like n=1 Tax=Pecten maximus TaxID=6579 RepID=UPI001458EE6E|nr:mucin-5AC-like [Pecten maximus]